MKNLKRIGMLSLIVVTLVFMSGVMTVADPGDGATINKEGTCYLSTAASGASMDLTTDNLHELETPSGNIKLTCNFKFDKEYAPAKAVKMNGFTCGTLFGSTNNTQSITTPAGTALLVCMVKANDELSE